MTSPSVSPLTSLAGRVAFVTGAGNGIGLAAAARLAAGGAKVGCFDIDQGDLDAAVKRITEAGGEALALPGDVARYDDVLAAVERTEQQYGRLDVVLANAGINGVQAPIDVMTVDDWHRTIETNLSGTWYTIKAATPYLKRQNAGSVIVVASVNGTRVFSKTGATAYSTSKAGQVAMTQMLALELSRQHIRVNVVCPGAIDTQIDESTREKALEGVEYKVEYVDGDQPLTGHPGSSDEVAELIYFLATDASSHISGAVIHIDGAESLLVG